MILAPCLLLLNFPWSNLRCESRPWARWPPEKCHFYNCSGTMIFCQSVPQFNKRKNEKSGKHLTILAGVPSDRYRDKGFGNGSYQTLSLLGFVSVVTQREDSKFPRVWDIHSDDRFLGRTLDYPKHQQLLLLTELAWSSSEVYQFPSMYRIMLNAGQVWGDQKVKKPDQLQGSC